MSITNYINNVGIEHQDAEFKDLNDIVQICNNFDNSDSENEVFDDNKIIELSANDNFEKMLLEMQNCLQDTVNFRNIVQNISGDKSNSFISLFNGELKNNSIMSNKIDLMEEISRQKYEISCLHRDKHVLVSQVTGLNKQMAFLQEENSKLKQELQTASSNDFASSNSSSRVLMENSKNISQIQQRAPSNSGLREKSLRDGTEESNCKSNSWSELRTHKVTKDEPFSSMVQVYRRYNSINNPQAHSRNTTFGRIENCEDNEKIIHPINSIKDFKFWSKNEVCVFLHEIGLGAYFNNSKNWPIDGLHLVESSKKEIEKEFHLTNKLHLKKLLIHIRRLTSDHVPAATYFSLARPGLKISPNFNIRLWLDDIGLLHYVSVFTANCMDGYMVDQISMDDLQHLKITNELHSVSIKRSIELLRKLEYDLSLLDRLSPECNGAALPDDVSRWTQRHVTDWLRSIELPEYASNIRGSGIHGAIFIYEDRFNASTLASVLNIPRNRSLLRRHLQAKFHELIGPSLVTKKRVVSESSGFVPLSATSKIKVHKKKNIFLGSKHKDVSREIEDLLLPFSVNVENFILKEN